MRAMFSSIAACALLALALGAVTPASLKKSNHPKASQLCSMANRLTAGMDAKTIDPRKWADVPAEKKAKLDQEIQDHWKIEGDTIVNDGKGAYLSTNEEYGDIELLVDYKTVPLADSGIYLRGTPQVQIWDYTEKAKFNLGADKGSGGLWNNSAGTPVRIHWYWPTSPSAMEFIPHYSSRCTHQRVAERQTSCRSCDYGKLL